MEEVKTRHKKEVKALDGTGRKLIKQANKNKKKVAEAEAKIAEVGRWGWYLRVTDAFLGGGVCDTRLSLWVLSSGLGER